MAVQTWHAQDGRSGHDVALSVIENVPADVTHRMVELSATVRHPHLNPVLDVIVDGSRVAVISSWPSAGRLSDLLDRRGSLSVGETLTVLRPVAAALAAIHRHGLVHGNLGAAVVGFDDAGRPLLGGLAAGLIAAHAQTDGPAQDAADLAPEVARGAAPSVAADVFSLGSVALRCLAGRSAWPADDPADVLVQSVGGVWPDVPDTLAPPRFVALVRRMLDSDPGQRPDAPGVLANLQRSGVALPVDLALDSGPGSDAAERAPADRASAGRVSIEEPALGGGHSDAAAAADVLSGLPAVVLGPQPTNSDGNDGVDPTPAAQWGSSGRAGAVRAGPPIVRRQANTLGSHAAGSAGASSGNGPSAARGRHGRQQHRRTRRQGPESAEQCGAALSGSLSGPLSGPVWGPVWGPVSGSLSGSRRIAVLGLAAALAVVVGAIVVQARSSLPDTSWPDDSRPAAAGGDAGADAADWLAVVTELDTARAHALSAADPALLDGVYTSSSAQRSADTAVVADLAAKGLRVQDGTHRIISAGIVPPDGAESTTVQVAVVDSMPAHPIVDAAGEPVGQTAARSEERRILVLASTAQGYRIESILAG